MGASTAASHTGRVKVVLADDHDVVLKGMAEILKGQEFSIVGMARDGKELLKIVAEQSPDVVVADLTMPNVNGLEATREIRRFDKKIKVVFLTMHPDTTYAVEALAAGGNGYVLKSSANEELVKAIRTVRDGETFVSETIADKVKAAMSHRSGSRRRPPHELTDRQREVLGLLAQGKSVKEIAGILRISPRTVEFHKYNMMEILGVHSVAELAVYATTKGLIP